MTLRRLFTLTALTVAASLSLGDRANATYDVSTSILNTSANGVGVLNTPFAAGFVIPVGGGVTAPNPGVWFSDGAGSTIYLLNYVQLNNSISSSVTPAELIYIRSTQTDSSSFGFTVGITVTDPSSSFTVHTFAQNALYLISTNGSGTGSANPVRTLIAPPGMVAVGPDLFSISNPQATPVSTNSSITATSSPPGSAVSSQITVVPEPASVVMFGIGLSIVVGLRMRRMKGQN